MKKTQIKDIIKQLGLPEETEWIGYGIHSVENDDFLWYFEAEGDIENLVWIKFPDKAKAFQSLNKAEKIRDKFKPEAEVVWMFDLGNQVFVTQPEGYGRIQNEPLH